MKPVTLFVAFGFLLVIAASGFAQDSMLPAGTEFPRLLETGPNRIKDLKLGFSTPNEIAGYRFFSEGRLKGLTLGISTEDDVIGIFGGKCEAGCEYDRDWLVTFAYAGRVSKIINEGGRARHFVAAPASANKILSAEFTPKKRLAVEDGIFSGAFFKSVGAAFGHDLDGNAKTVSVRSLTDSYGLSYTIFDHLLLDQTGRRDDRRKGELISVNYRIPNDLEDSLFSEQK